jgi:NAD(P)-dependent dehydrogenase (short-subunit alcohol dehydrogenase family)
MSSAAPVDLGDLDQARAWVDDAAAEHGGIDVLFNNASSPRVGPFTELTPTTGTTRSGTSSTSCISRRRPHGRTVARGGGSVVNTASIAAIRGAAFTEQAAHGAAKGGVLAFTYHLAASGLRTGSGRTRSSRDDPHRRPSSFHRPRRAGMGAGARQPLGRVGEAEDVAKVAVFLASDDAWFVNAAAIPVDGGASVVPISARPCRLPRHQLDEVPSGSATNAIRCPARATGGAPTLAAARLERLAKAASRSTTTNATCAVLWRAPRSARPTPARLGRRARRARPRSRRIDHERDLDALGNRRRRRVL